MGEPACRSESRHQRRSHRSAADVAAVGRAATGGVSPDISAWPGTRPQVLGDADQILDPLAQLLQVEWCREAVTMVSFGRTSTLFPCSQSDQKSPA